MKILKLLVVIFIFLININIVLGAETIKPYGNLYVFFGYQNSKTYNAAEESEVDQDALYVINDNSNLGFNFSYKRYEGVFELGISDVENDRDVKVRKAYGIYSFGIGKLLIGQAWNPYVKWSHEAANYYRSEGFGSLSEDPTTQLRFSTNFGVYINIIKPYVKTKTYYTNQEVDNPEASSDAANDEYILVETEREITTKQPLDNIQSMIPKMAIGYDFNSTYFDFSLGAAGNIYQIKEIENVNFDKNWIITYLGYLNMHFGYKSFTFDISGGYAVNPANFGINVQSNGNTTYYGGAAASVYNIATDEYEIKDTWNVQSYVELGYAFTNSTIIHLGYGFSVVDYPIENTKKDYAMEFYCNAKITFGGLIALTPSVSYRDYMKDLSGDKEGHDLSAGILSTVSFY